MLDIIDREQVTDLIPVSEEVCHVANLAPKLPEHVRYVGPSTSWMTRWHDKLAFVNHAIERHNVFMEDGGSVEHDAAVIQH